ncbi:MAG: DUF3048 domain-containing protein [Oscillospiraceae bacterium]
MRKKYRAWALVLAFVLMLAGCGPKEGTVTPEPSPSPSESADVTFPPSESPAPSAPVLGSEINPLTGLPLPEGSNATQRPVAVMLNNIRKALPQQGNSQADIIYEALAEGGITRMLGVYQSMDGVGEVGSVRSSRPYYLELALGLDAIYLHAGGSEEAYADIVKWNVTALDCVRTTDYSKIFWRDPGRLKNNGYEHSVLTSGAAIMENFPTYSFRKEHSEDFSLPYTFTEDGTPDGGVDAKVIRVPFSKVKTGIFIYDEETGKYLVEEYGQPLVDGNNGEQVAVTNVVTIRVNCKTIDDYGRLRVDLSGYKGDGWFACGGKMVEIAWEKKDLNSPITYALADGSPVVFGEGNSYVNLIPLSNEAKAE